MDYLFPLNTATVALSGLAVIAGTAFKHFAFHKKVVGESPARGKLLYDEAFSVMKGFFEKASLHTIEDLQTFGNNFVPAPFWVRVIRVLIPLSTREEANEILIQTLGEEEIEKVVGGRTWWGQTANEEGGVNGEWISMKRDWQGLEGEEGDEEFEKVKEERVKRMKEEKERRDKRRWKVGREKEKRAERAEAEGGVGATEAVTDDEGGEDGEEGDETYTEEMDEMRCLLYIHGGAYFFGSPNTHRYSIWRYARKIGGRAFAVQYRLAPQYPFPCALADALASYLYLIRPPPGAKHRPVDPAKLTLAGDSAGGGLTLALLCLIRDSGLPAPAGAALISPWCDLTHSFPSILQNTKTDIIPAYGFLFKPSTLWPPPPPEFQKRAKESTSLHGLKHAAELYTSSHSSKSKSNFLPHLNRDKKGKELASKIEGLPDEDPQRAEGSTKDEGHKQSTGEVGETLKLKIDGEEVEVTDQIQLYATNDQLVYPFVSPIWQPSLGGLPPLYIMCGDQEVLRDEIIYMAHRAANPKKYPVRQHLLDANPERTKKHAEYPPTKVHLQVYDGACHDLPLFSFTVPAKYCYRAIASFLKFVTSPSDIERASTPVSPTDMELPVEADPSHPDSKLHHDATATAAVPNLQLPTPPHTAPASPTSSSFLSPPAPTTTSRSTRSRSPSRARESSATSSTSNNNTNTNEKIKPIPNLEQTIYSSTQPFNRPPYVDNMVRERVGVTGVVRPLDKVEDLKILSIDPEEVGLIKEAPVKRYLAGKTLWEKRFASTYEKVQKKREHHLKKSMREEATRLASRLKTASSRSSAPSTSSSTLSPTSAAAQATSGSTLLDPTEHPPTASPEPLDDPYVKGLWALDGERPPPSSIAARKDTMEARKLARVLDEHYSKLNALNLLGELGRITTRTSPLSGVEGGKGGGGGGLPTLEEAKGLKAKKA